MQRTDNDNFDTPGFRERYHVILGSAVGIACAYSVAVHILNLLNQPDVGKLWVLVFVPVAGFLTYFLSRQSIANKFVSGGLKFKSVWLGVVVGVTALVFILFYSLPPFYAVHTLEISASGDKNSASISEAIEVVGVFLPDQTEISLPDAISGEWEGYADGRLSPAPEDSYVVWCGDGLASVYSSDSGDLVTQFPIRNLVALSDEGWVDGGSGATFQRFDDKIVVSTAETDRLKVFGLDTCLQRNGDAPLSWGDEPPPSPPGTIAPFNAAQLEDLLGDSVYLYPESNLIIRYDAAFAGDVKVKFRMRYDLGIASVLWDGEEYSVDLYRQAGNPVATLTMDGSAWGQAPSVWKFFAFLAVAADFIVAACLSLILSWVVSTESVLTTLAPVVRYVSSLLEPSGANRRPLARRVAGWLTNFALMLVALVVTLLTLELILNTQFGRRHIFSMKGDFPEIQIFEDNSAGFRDVEHAVGSPSGVTRVLLLGDSVTAGQGVTVTEYYPALLREKAGQSVEFIVAAEKGASTRNQINFLADYGCKFSPNIVVVGIVSNDPEDADGAPQRQPEWQYATLELPRLRIAHMFDYGLNRLGDRLGLRYNGLSWENDLYEKPVVDSWRDQVRQLAEEASECDALTLYAFTLPNATDYADPNMLSIYEQKYTIATDVFNQAGFTTINLMQPYLAEFGDVPYRSLWALPNDDHPNAAVHRWYAEQIWAVLEKDLIVESR